MHALAAHASTPMCSAKVVWRLEQMVVPSSPSVMMIGSGRPGIRPAAVPGVPLRFRAMGQVFGQLVIVEPVSCVSTVQ